MHVYHWNGHTRNQDEGEGGTLRREDHGVLETFWDTASRHGSDEGKGGIIGIKGKEGAINKGTGERGKDVSKVMHSQCTVVHSQ